MLDLLPDGRGSDFSVKAVLNESLTMLVSNFLHIDIPDASGEVFHGPCRFVEGRTANLSVRAHQTILKEIRQSH
jgi:hypothetical protein